MKIEPWYLAVVFILLVTFLIGSTLVGLFFGLFYVMILALILITGSILLFLILYLRIQHNIDRQGNKLIKINELRGFIDNKFAENKKIYEEIVDFSESMLKFLEDEKIERKDGFDSLKQELDNIPDSLKQEVNNALESLNNNLTTKLEEKDELQKKIIVIMEQILDYQREQTGFLREEINKIKNESKRIRRK